MYVFVKFQLLTNEQQPTYDAINQRTADNVNDSNRPSTSADSPEHAEADPPPEPTRLHRVRKTWDSVYNATLKNSHLVAFFAMLVSVDNFRIFLPKCFFFSLKAMAI